MLPRPPRGDSLPEVSVVIPTYRREGRLAFALDALAAQTLSRERFEVLVVRDSEEGPLTTAPDGLEVRFLTASGPGPAVRRNHGWRAARAPLVAFTDDDCRPAPDWLERVLGEWSGEDDVLLQGWTGPDPDEVHQHFGLARTINTSELDSWYPTCNIAYPRALLERLGGFDEELSFHGEDTDLGLRAEEAGARPVFIGDAVVHHAIKVRRFRHAIADALERKGEPALLARHPRHRERLYLRAFHKRSHATLLLALAAIPLWRRSRLLATLAIAPHLGPPLWSRLTGPSPASPAKLAHVGITLVVSGLVDAVEIAARARASVRHRQLVL